jgi:CHAD domain-containing protein
VNARRPNWIERARGALAASLSAAASAFSDADGGGTRAVHDARKELKRSASLARGFGQVVGPEAYVALEAANAARRAYGRARDLDVLPFALGRVKCDPETRAVLTRAMALQRGEAIGGVGPQAPDMAARLAAAAAAVQAWNLAEIDDSGLAAMLRHTFRSAKRRGAAAFSSGDADDLHELRTGVIDLGHQFEVLRPVWPALIEAQSAELARLRQTLGDFNDLTVLGEFALRLRSLDVDATEAFVEAVQKRRKPLERKARAQFERAFAERPGAFARRMTAYMAHPQGLE